MRLSRPLYRALLALSLLAGLWLQPVPASAREVLLVAEQASPALHLFAASLQERRPQDRVRLLDLPQLPQPLPDDSRLVLFGSNLLAWRRNQPQLPPTLILQISRLQGEERLRAGPLPQGISLLWSDPPVERQLRLIRLLMPHARRVGVLLSAASQAQQAELEQAARRQQLRLHVEHWNDTRDNRPLGKVLDHSDVLLGLDDPLLFNPLTIKQILLTSYDQRKALIGPTAAFIRAGSLSSTYSNPQDWLDSLDELLDQPPAHWPQAAYVRNFHVMHNPSVARSLGIEQDNDEQLVQLLRLQEMAP